MFVPYNIAIEAPAVKEVVDMTPTHTIFEVDSVSKETFDMVVRYMQFMQERPIAISEVEGNLVFKDEWFFEYIDVDRETCFSLVEAAKALKLRSLENLACAKITEIMTGKSLKLMRGFYEFIACTNKTAVTN